jgi:hypothetical protein
MGYFDKSIDTHFKLNADGKQVVYPWSDNRGYILSNVQQYLNMRNTLRRKLIFDRCILYFFCFIPYYINRLNIVQLNPYAILLIAIGALTLIEELINYDLRHRLVTLEKLVVTEKPPVFSFIISFLFLIGSVWSVWDFSWVLSDDKDFIRFIVILMITISAYLCIKNARLIIARKANTPKKTT